jgi:hypothetical protein
MYFVCTEGGVVLPDAVGSMIHDPGTGPKAQKGLFGYKVL